MFKMIYKWTDKIKDKVAKLSARLDEKGQGIVEYAMILAAVAIIAFAVLYGTSDTNLEGAVTNAFSNAGSKVQDVTNKSVTSGGGGVDSDGNG